MTRRSAAFASLMALLVLAAGCSDRIGPAHVGNAPPDSLAGLIVSQPVGGPRGPSGSARGLRSSPLVAGSVVYVSLVPGTVPDGMQATIRDQATGASVTTAVVGGGFDPVGIPASVGDTLLVEITRGGSAGVLRALSLVRPSHPPVVVRTSPPRGGRDVPLNASMVIVFSEPLDSATADTGSVKLWRSTTPLAGTVRLADAAHLRAEFHPDSPLAPQTDYQLVVTTAIRDLNGLALASAITVPFTTGTGTAYSIGGTVSGLAGAGLVLRLNSIAVAVQEDLPVAANGPIVFASTLEGGVDYRVTVATLPSNPAQLCVVALGGDTLPSLPYMSANVTDISITCSGADPSLTGKILFTAHLLLFDNKGQFDNARDIMMLDLDQSTITRLTSSPDYDDRSPQWSPDRSRIAFIRTGTRDGSTTPPGLWVMRADGSGAVQILAPPNTLVQSFCWSPDGRRLAVEYADGNGRDVSFGTISADGSGAITLADSGGCNSWSPDGSTIVFEKGKPDQSDWPGMWVYLMDPDGSNVRRLTSATTYGGFEPQFEREPAWSPDGTKVAFYSSMYGITVVGREGTTAYSATQDYYNPLIGTGSPPWEYGPDWSPDGTHLAFAMHGQLFVTKADGSGTARQLTSVPGGIGEGPAWLK